MYGELPAVIALIMSGLHGLSRDTRGGLRLGRASAQGQGPSSNVPGVVSSYRILHAYRACLPGFLHRSTPGALKHWLPIVMLASRSRVLVCRKECDGLIVEKPPSPLDLNRI